MGTRNAGSIIPPILLPSKYFPHMASEIWGARNRFGIFCVKFTLISCKRIGCIVNKSNNATHILSGSTSIYPFPGGSPPGAQLPLDLVEDHTTLRAHALPGRRTGILPLRVFCVSGKVSTSPDFHKILLKLVDVYLPILHFPEMLLYSLHQIRD